MFYAYFSLIYDFPIQLDFLMIYSKFLSFFMHYSFKSNSTIDEDEFCPIAENKNYEFEK